MDLERLGTVILLLLGCSVLWLFLFVLVNSLVTFGLDLKVIYFILYFNCYLFIGLEKAENQLQQLVIGAGSSSSSPGATLSGMCRTRFIEYPCLIENLFP